MEAATGAALVSGHDVFHVPVHLCTLRIWKQGLPLYAPIMCTMRPAVIPRVRLAPTNTPTIVTPLVTQCVHEHTAECYSDGILPAEGEEKAADACTHVCSEESGCITKELNCPHVHDETCGYSEGSPCTFDPSDCELCNPTDSGEPEAPAECTCETLCTADSVNPDCPVCSAEGADLTACAGTVEEGDAAPRLSRPGSGSGRTTSRGRAAPARRERRKPRGS